jgi:hypothetical protein
MSWYSSSTYYISVTVYEYFVNKTEYFPYCNSFFESLTVFILKSFHDVCYSSVGRAALVTIMVYHWRGRGGERWEWEEFFLSCCLLWYHLLIPPLGDSWPLGPDPGYTITSHTSLISHHTVQYTVHKHYHSSVSSSRGYTVHRQEYIARYTVQ